MSESQNPVGGRRLNEAASGQPTTSTQDVGGGRGRGRGRERGQGRGRGRGRGQGRGRGRGRGRWIGGAEQTATLEDPLHQIRVERQITQRRMATLPANVRQELVARKRKAHLERMLMPDAPPRKRQTKRPSPERQPCIVVDQSANLTEATEIEASTSGVPHSANLFSAETAEVKAPTSGGARFFEPGRAEASTSSSSEYCPVVIEYVGEAAPMEPDRIGTPDADTVPNSPYSSPSRLSTANSLPYVTSRPTKKRGYPRSSLESE